MRNIFQSGGLPKAFDFFLCGSTGDHLHKSFPQLDTYKQLLQFLDDNQYNFPFVPMEMQGAVTDFNKLKNDPWPISGLRGYIKLQRQLSGIMDGVREELREKIKAAYNDMFDYLKQVAEKQHVPESVLSDRETVIRVKTTPNNILVLQNTVLKAGSEVSNALVLYNYSDEKSKVEAKRITVLEQNVEDTRKLMSEAGGSYLEVIQAQSSLLNVQLSKVADDFYKMQAVVNLYYALGGGAK